MRSPFAIGVAIAALFLGAVFVGSRLGGGGSGDDDSVAADSPSNVQPAPSSPDRFFASDQRLLQDGARAIREKAVDAATGKGQAGVPYYIELADGRYAFGRTDAFGNTRPLFTDGPIAHKVHWDEEALARTKAAIAAPPEPPVVAATRSVVQRWNETVEPFDFTRSRRARGAAAIYERPTTSTTIGSVQTCRFATSGDSPIAKACELGGRTQAKEEMKRLVAVAKANGKKFTCEGCHESLDSYGLKDNARDDFAMLLAATHVSGGGN